MELLHGAGGPDDLPGGVEGEEGFDEVLLAPEAEVGNDELLRVVQRSEDVVEVDEDAGSEERDDAEALPEDVAVDGDDMTGVDEEDVAGAEGAEDVQRDLLNGEADQLSESGKGGSEEGSRMGLDGGEFAGGAIFGISAEGRSEQEGGVAASDFDDALWAAMAHEGPCNFSVHTLEESIVEVKLEGIGRCFGKGPFGGVGQHVGVDALHLFAKAKVEAIAGAAGSPVFAAEGTEGGDGEVEVGRGNADSEAILQSLKDGRESNAEPGVSRDAVQRYTSSC